MTDRLFAQNKRGEVLGCRSKPYLGSLFEYPELGSVMIRKLRGRVATDDRLAAHLVSGCLGPLRITRLTEPSPPPPIGPQNIDLRRPFAKHTPAITVPLLCDQLRPLEHQPVLIAAPGQKIFPEPVFLGAEFQPALIDNLKHRRVFGGRPRGERLARLRFFGGALDIKPRGREIPLGLRPDLRTRPRPRRPPGGPRAREPIHLGDLTHGLLASSGQSVDRGVNRFRDLR